MFNFIFYFYKVNHQNNIPQNPRSSQTLDVVGGGLYKLKNKFRKTFCVNGMSFIDINTSFTDVNTSTTDVNTSATDVNTSATDVNKSTTDVSTLFTDVNKSFTDVNKSFTDVNKSFIDDNKFVRDILFSLINKFHYKN
jgi:hypothetical protein